MKQVLLIVLSVILLTPPEIVSGEPTLIQLREKADVSGDTVLLKHIAALTGPDAHDLAGLSIMPAPQSPLPSSISAMYVAQKVRAMHSGVVAFSGSEEVSITQRYVTIPTKTLEEIFIREVMAKSPWKDHATIVVENFKTPGHVRVREIDAQRSQAKFSPHENFLGLTTMTLQFGRGSSSASFNLSARVRAIAHVPVAKTPIDRGALITRADLETRELDISAFPSIILDPQECVGMRAKTGLRQGRPILRINVEVPPVVSRGDLVTLEVRVNSLIVQDKGIALRDGNFSDQIPVKNITSGKQVIGTVIAVSVVQVKI
ncbi:MAG TPA: flagellar basal body P-ring formation protein FlgA [Deltaproteobacteria bacterium]|nr:flagellar basal body P-ring formation protein FlgA [Deltaproteobacteria bacterium]